MLKIIKRLVKKTPHSAIALVLSVSMVLSLVTFALPTVRELSGAGGTSETYKNLYKREADPNTMDSYVQASLGGYVDATSSATGTDGKTIVNNYGTRYAGEVWSDLSVFARGQRDGDFNGTTLKLDKYTDGVKSSVDMMDYTDFLNVFSVLGSSEATMDEEPLPLDVVFVLDTSASMSSAGEKGRYNTEAYVDPDDVAPGNKNARLEYAADALNVAFDLLMNNGSKYNRVGLVTYDRNVRTIMDLGRYEPSVVDRSAKDSEGNYIYSKGYHNGEERYFTIAQASLEEAAKTVKIPYVSAVLESKTLTTGDRVNQQEKYGDYFTILWGSGNSNGSPGVSNSSKSWSDDGYSSDWRINFREAATTTAGSIKFTTSGPVMVKVWWVPASPIGSELCILNSEGKIVAMTEPDDTRIANNTYISTFDLSDAGTYYLGSTEDRNFIYKVEVSKYTQEIYNSRNTNADEKPVVYGRDETLPSAWRQNNQGNYTFDHIDQYNNDPRFPQALRAYNANGTEITGNYDPANASYYTLADGGAYADDWKVVEINAVAQDGKYAGEVHSQAPENPQDTSKTLNYFYTHSNTNTPDGVNLAMQMLEEAEDVTVELYRDSDGKLTDTPQKGKDVEVELPRRPLVVLISDGAPAPNSLSQNWWEVTTSKSSNATPPKAGVPTIVAAAAAYGKKKINEHYYSDPAGTAWGDETLKAEVHTIGFMLNAQTADGDKEYSRATLDPGGLINGAYGNTGAYKTALDHMKNFIAAANSGQGYSMSPYTMKYNSDWGGNKTLADLIYTDGFHETEDPTKLPDIFRELLQNVLNEAFTPVEGSNASGSVKDDTLTYMNPIGRYMAVDDVTDLTMFGEHYKVGKYAEYKNGTLTGVNGNTVTETAESLIPTLAADQKTGKDTKTTYTVYRITGMKNGGSITDTTRKNLSYTDEVSLSDVTFDLYDDIHIWVEDTGDYNDTDPEGGGFVVEGGYDQALYVEIHTNALPTQIAAVKLQTTTQGRDPTVPVSYSTNLSTTEASTPLRVYYSVSLDADYLRYDSEENKGKRENAVGVAMADIDAVYSSNYTDYYKIGSDGHYDKVAEGASTTGANRYTAFYSSYFTDSKYNYPVEEGVTRGNTVVSFAASEGNQFYRFSKNRVLFLIPGSEGDPRRPSELELGSLSNTWVKQNGEKWEVVAKGTDGAEKVNPTNFEHLLAVLNAKRANIDGKGTESTYYRNGDCIPVDGGTYTLKDGSVKNQISSDNWYYIIREYYVPNSFPDNDTTTTNVELRYTAIARKGSEFGSAIGVNAGTDNMGDMIEWYHPETKATSTFTNSESGHFGYPGGDNTAVPTPGGGHTHNGGWYVSAKPSGLRVGGMANFVGTKGGAIRAGDSTNNGDANITETAGTYFLPTVSSYTLNQTTNKIENVVINLYEGNNGRILVDQTLLLVTKRVTDLGGVDLENETEFEFTVSILGFSGLRSAVKVMWDREAQKWRRTIGTIYAHTNPDGLLYGPNNELATYNGQYILISGAGNGSAVVYQYSEDGSGRQETTDPDTGKTTVTFTTTVQLVDPNNYNPGRIPSGTTVSDFVIATMDPNNSELGANTANVTLKSDYGIKTEYLTKSGIEFEYDEDTGMGTATIKLKSGEGLLFNTIANNANFTVTEHLVYGDVDLVKDGWEFVSINEVTDPEAAADRFTYTYTGKDDDPDKAYTYTITGTTGQSEAYAHYINRNMTGLTISKDVEAADGTTLRDEDKEKGFTFTIKLEDSQGSLLTGPYNYKGRIDGKDVKGHLVATAHTHTPSDDKEGFLVENDIVADSAGIWEVTLKDGEYINIANLPKGAKYTVTEKETGQLYVPKAVKDPDMVNGPKNRDGDVYVQEGTIPDDVDQDDQLIKVEFVNVKKKPDPVTISLTATKTVENTTLAESDYSFTITSFPDNPEGDPIPTGGKTVPNDASGQITFAGIQFTKPGTYNYYVSEDPGSKPGISYDGTVYIVTVTVREKYAGIDGKEYTGQLEASVSVNGGSSGTWMTGDNNSSVSITNGTTFTNSYDPTKISITLNGVKNFINGTLTPGQFTFILTGIPNGDDLPPAPEGGWTYSSGTLIEPSDDPDDPEDPEDNGTDEPDEPDVTTTPDVSGQPDTPASSGQPDTSGDPDVSGDPVEPDAPVEPVEPGPTDTAAPGSDLADMFVIEQGERTISGTVSETDDGSSQDPDDPYAGEAMPLAGGTVLDSVIVVNDANGVIPFGKITFDEVGTYKYQIKEVKPDDAGSDIIYDGKVCEVTVNVRPGDGALIAETTITVTGGGTVDGAGSIKLIEFTNTAIVGGLTVSKTVTGDKGETDRDFHFTVTLSDKTISGIYGDMDFSGGVASFTLKHGESKTATGFPPGITYTVTETEANQGGYTTTATGDTGTIPANGTAEAAFENRLDDTPNTGNLTVSKTVTGNAADFSKEFNFTVRLSDTSINRTYGDMTFINGVATFTLKDGESKTATGLPAGITYTVTEEDANQDGYRTSSTGATGTIPEGDTAKAAFTNSKTTYDDGDEYGDLTVKKTVTGETGETDREFTFTVTLGDTSINGTYGGMTFVNGVATFTLKDSESKTAKNLPAGISYTVTEAEADQDGYTTTATGASGTIPANGTATAEFVNDRGDEFDPEKGALTVSKTVGGNAGDQAQEFHFTVVLSDDTINGTYGGMTFVGGVAQVTLRHGGSITATGLPADVSYTVTEAEADSDGYVTSASGSTGTIPGGGTASAGFTNTRDEEIEPDEGNLIASKIVGGTEGDRNRQFTFTVTLSDNTINGTYGDMTFVGGVARFTLRHGESRVARGLPSGVTYSVTEAEANQDGYTTASKGRNGTIPEGGTAQATFFNTKGEPLPDDPPLEDFDDPPIPKGDAPEFPDDTSSSDNPRTGDESHLILWLALATTSAIGLIAIAFVSNRNRILFSYKGRHTRK